MLKRGLDQKWEKRKSSRQKKATPNDEKEELSRLRTSIEEITESIIDLVNARQNLSVEVARIKRLSNAPIENLQVELSLQSKVHDYAEEVGVDPLLASKMLSLILDSSKAVQRRSYYEESIRSFLREKRIDHIAVIGAGRMGGWFASYFTGLLHPPIIYDRDTKKAKSLARLVQGKPARNLDQVAREADLVVVAIPISRTPAFVRQLMQKLPRRRGHLLILELTSVKDPLVRAGLIGKDAKKPDNIALYSIHPMFGPDAMHFAENKMLEISENMEGDRLLQGLFPHFKILTLNAQEHDKMMSYVLSLPHLVSLLFADVITNAESQIKDYSGPSFDRMLDLARKVLSESPSVYFDIQSSNPENSKMLKQLRKSLDYFDSMSRDKEAFRNFFEKTQTKLIKQPSQSA